MLAIEMNMTTTSTSFRNIYALYMHYGWDIAFDISLDSAFLD